MYRYIIICFFLLSCSNKETAVTTVQNTGIQLRYRNISPDPFKVLETKVGDSTYTFANVEPGALTDFIKVPETYAYHYAKVITEKDTLIFQPIDFVGEQAYTTGYMTLSLDIAAEETGKRYLVYSRNGANPVRDYHTMASDVIDNLFVFLNAKDWKAVNTFYADDAILKDEHNTVIKISAADHFKNLFNKEDINYIYVDEQKAVEDGIMVKAFTRKGTRSAEYPVCYHFVIKDNRVTEQRALSCTE